MKNGALDTLLGRSPRCVCSSRCPFSLLLAETCKRTVRKEIRLAEGARDCI